MTAWEIDSTNKSKAYIRAIRYRLKMKAANRCIQDGRILAPTSTIFCSTCLAKHGDRNKAYNAKNKQA